MQRLSLFLLLFLSISLFSQQKNKEIHIFKLLPYISRPPLVNPYLPCDFVLGERKDDPHFISGYYWGSQGSLSDYFNDSTTLKGCLIHSRLVTTVRQEGFDRFSNDGEMNDLISAGFTEIKIRKGKWGIFPYRERIAKAPRGRKYYQIWVGLNTKEGGVLNFQLLYPEYLNEPMQYQKQIWENFVNRTMLLDMNDLLIVGDTRVTIPKDFQVDQLKEKVHLIVEKRRSDQKFLIRIEPSPRFSAEIEVLGIKEASFFNGVSLTPCIEVEIFGIQDNEIFLEKIRVDYKMVDLFFFTPNMLYVNRLMEKKNYLFFQ